MKLHEFLVLTSNRQNLVNFLVENKVINNYLKCENCDNIINLDIDKFEYKCTNSYYIIDSHKKRQRVKCHFRKSAKKNT